jgi:hypothetical protein
MVEKEFSIGYMNIPQHSLGECVTYQICMKFIVESFIVPSDLKNIIIIIIIIQYHTWYNNVLNNRGK